MELLIPFPPQDLQLRDGKEIKTWMLGYEQALLDTQKDLKKAQQAILCNQKDAVMNENYILEYLNQIR